MSTLEKAIDLLHKMPETNLEMVYSFMKFLQTQSNEDTKNNFSLWHCSQLRQPKLNCS